MWMQRSPLMFLSPACAAWFLAKLGNERIACAFLFCNCAEPCAVRALACEDLKVYVALQLAFLPNGGAPAHRAANDCAAAPRDSGSR